MAIAMTMGPSLRHSELGMTQWIAELKKESHTHWGLRLRKMASISASSPPRRIGCNFSSSIGKMLKKQAVCDSTRSGNKPLGHYCHIHVAKPSHIWVGSRKSCDTPAADGGASGCLFSGVNWGPWGISRVTSANKRHTDIPDIRTPVMLSRGPSNRQLAGRTQSPYPTVE